METTEGIGTLYSEEDDEQESSSGTKPSPRGKVKRRKWSEKEKALIKGHFGEPSLIKKLPATSECREFIANHDVLRAQPVQTNRNGSSSQFPQRKSVIRPNHSVPQRDTVLQQNPNFNYYQRNPKPNYPPRVNHVNPHHDDNVNQVSPHCDDNVNHVDPHHDDDFYERVNGFYDNYDYTGTAYDSDASQTSDYHTDSNYEPPPREYYHDAPQEYYHDAPREVNFQDDPLLDRPPLELFEDMSEMVMDEVYPQAHSSRDELPYHS
nr:unnamed protein product [Callosobruchus analis]